MTVGYTNPYDRSAYDAGDDDYRTGVEPMTERPILFSAPMVRAILASRKTQTRRVVRLPPHVLARGVDPRMAEWLPRRYSHGSGQYPGGNPNVTGDQPPGLHVTCLDNTCQHIACPYGHRGDRLWVKENFASRLDQDHVLPSSMRSAFYWADENTVNTGCDGAAGKVRPSIFMPRHLSRLTLEITDVRVEPLQAITEDDARAEGIGDGGRDAFASLWDSINAKRGLAWASNPWVWALTFRRIA